MMSQVTPGVDLDDAEVVGRVETDVDSPGERQTESAARLCPYCERLFKGRIGVFIHLGQMAGRKDHPANASMDFPVVEIDEEENVVAVVNGSRITVGNQRREYFREGGGRTRDEDLVKLTVEQVHYFHTA